MLICLESYVISITLLTRYLKMHAAQKWILKVEVLINIFCAIGIFLGRFQRLNSWTIVTRFDNFLAGLKYDISHILPLIITIAIFIVIYTLFLISKKINILIFNIFFSRKV
jgi:uncharacterized membrane protein